MTFPFHSLTIASGIFQFLVSLLDFVGSANGLFVEQSESDPGHCKADGYFCDGRRAIE